jgi:hypothetical protein
LKFKLGVKNKECKFMTTILNSMTPSDLIT